MRFISVFHYTHSQSHVDAIRYCISLNSSAPYMNLLRLCQCICVCVFVFFLMLRSEKTMCSNTMNHTISNCQHNSGSMSVRSMTFQPIHTDWVLLLKIQKKTKRFIMSSASSRSYIFVSGCDMLLQIAIYIFFVSCHSYHQLQRAFILTGRHLLCIYNIIICLLKVRQNLKEV